MSAPSQAEIEAAAEALGRVDLFDWRSRSAADQRLDDARRALGAALPLVEARLRERIASDLEAVAVAGLEPGPGKLGPATRWGIVRAARIVRGGS